MLQNAEQVEYSLRTNEAIVLSSNSQIKEFKNRLFRRPRFTTSELDSVRFYDPLQFDDVNHS